MKSDSDNSGKQKSKSDGRGDERPPDKVRDAARTFIKKLRQDDPNLVPAVESCDDHKRNGRSNVISAEQAGNHRPNNVAEDTRRFIKKLRESGYEAPVVTLSEMGSSSSGKQSAHSCEQAAKNLHDATSSYIKGLKETEPMRNEPPKVKLAEDSSKTYERIAVSKSTTERSKTTTPSSSLPPRDSPLTKVFAGQYLSSLVEETIRYRKLSYGGLAHEMSIPEMVLREAVQGKLGLTRGQWVKLGQLLKLPTDYQLRPGERDGAPCWEVCYPPVPARVDKA